MRRSNRLSLPTAGLQVHECQEGLEVTRADRCELHPDSLSTVRPPHDSVGSYCVQLGRLAKDQVKVGTDREQLLRKEAEPGAAHVLSLLEVVRRPFRQGDSQGWADREARFRSFFIVGIVSAPSALPFHSWH